VSGQLPIDVCLIQVSPPDPHGYCSLGVAVECTKTAAQCARTVIAQINPQVPRVHGDCFIHVSRIDILVECDAPLLELPPDPVTDVQIQIGKHVGRPHRRRLHPSDGELAEFPDSVWSFLESHRNLGVHTEMFSDRIIPLIESGVINGERKTLHPGQGGGFLRSGYQEAL
jgi:acyl-CoA hydrolase